MRICPAGCKKVHCSMPLMPACWRCLNLCLLDLHQTTNSYDVYCFKNLLQYRLVQKSYSLTICDNIFCNLLHQRLDLWQSGDMEIERLASCDDSNRKFAASFDIFEKLLDFLRILTVFRPSSLSTTESDSVPSSLTFSHSDSESFTSAKLLNILFL